MVNRQAPDTRAAFWRQLTGLVVVNGWLCIAYEIYSHAVWLGASLSSASLLNGWSKWQNQANSITNVIRACYESQTLWHILSTLQQQKKRIQADDYDPDYTSEWIWKKTTPWAYSAHCDMKESSIVDSLKWVVKQYQESSTPKFHEISKRKLFPVDNLTKG